MAILNKEVKRRLEQIEKEIIRDGGEIYAESLANVIDEMLSETLIMTTDNFENLSYLCCEHIELNKNISVTL